MSMYPDSQSRPFELDYGTDDKAVFHFFNTVYAWMCVGLGVTATVAWLGSQHMAFMQAIAGRGVAVAFLLGTALLAYSIRAAAAKLSPMVATGLFLLFAAIIGAFLSFIFLIYPMQTIVGSFVMTAGVFGGMSVYGFVTKRDLTKMGSILIMCVWGLFLATIVNIFIASSAVSWIITYAVLAVFIGLVAYDTQMLKQMALQTQGDVKLAQRYAIVGSLSLYVDFINIFMSILRIMGSRR
ncbi:MAG: Bax inhibitor-1/YccA family protein [Tepidisphaeraceae bacterium]